jgi:hypothetical protein
VASRVKALASQRNLPHYCIIQAVVKLLFYNNTCYGVLLGGVWKPVYLASENPLILEAKAVHYVF